MSGAFAPSMSAAVARGVARRRPEAASAAPVKLWAIGSIGSQPRFRRIDQSSTGAQPIISDIFEHGARSDIRVTVTINKLARPTIPCSGYRRTV